MCCSSKLRSTLNHFKECGSVLLRCVSVKKTKKEGANLKTKTIVSSVKKESRHRTKFRDKVNPIEYLSEKFCILKPMHTWFSKKKQLGHAAVFQKCT